MNLLALLEQGRLKLLNNDNIKLSLRSLQYEYTFDKDTYGNIIKKFRIFGNYTHIAEGLIRAAWLAKEKSIKLWVDYF